MTQGQFYTWLQDPSSLDASSIAQLREVIARYPYFQTAQMMLAKNLRSENHIDQLVQLQLAAVMVPNRKLFQDYLYDKRRTEPEKVVAEKEGPLEEKQEESLEEHGSTPEMMQEPHSESVEVAHDSLYDLIPEPIIYQLETADLPKIPVREPEDIPEPDVLSFSQWLDHAERSKQVPEPYEERKRRPERSLPPRDNAELIDHFLSQQTKKPQKRAEFYTAQKAGAKSLEPDFTVVTETLAHIYVQQEKYELAAQAYTALSLKYPEKSAYFAARLKEINDKQNSV